ncbi:MAG: leucyl aminopeptidase [Spirochaetia bacterium]|nr:leucyl aminopeptidase [Spirochaetia bacterium]
MKNIPFEIPSPALIIKTGKPTAQAVRILPVFKGFSTKKLALKGDLPRLIDDFVFAKTFTARAGEILDLTPRGAILVGLGSVESFHPDTLAGLMITLAPKLVRYEGKSFVLVLSSEISSAMRSSNGGSGDGEDPDEESNNDYYAPLSDEELVSQAVTSLLMGSDPMESLKSKPAKATAKKPTQIHLECDFLKKGLNDAIERGVAVGELTNQMRFVESLPGNYFHPEYFQTYTESLTHKHGVKLKVYSMAELEKLGCGGIVSVGKGSKIPPRMMVLEYKPKSFKNKKPMVLVGKGITFDTGGISIKPAGEMHEMKYDMCGAAIVVHALALASRRKLPVHVMGIVGIAENMPGGNAIKPGDVYTAYNGVTVEIQNTDAEGRLVLGDLLAFASKNFQPGLMFDFATLTGACVVALGHETAAVLTSDDELATQIDRMSRRSLDRTWRMPHWKQYSANLKSDIADIRNIAGRDGGTITAYRFLAKFVEKKIPWAHFDIAGIAWHSKGYGPRTRGASGWGLALLNRYFEELSAKK